MVLWVNGAGTGEKNLEKKKKKRAAVTSKALPNDTINL